MGPRDHTQGLHAQFPPASSKNKDTRTLGGKLQKSGQVLSKELAAASIPASAMAAATLLGQTSSAAEILSSLNLQESAKQTKKLLSQQETTEEATEY